jgi:transcriptional regulator with XRE-family HTH domain
MDELSLAEKFHLSRRARGLTIIELAKRSGINRNTIAAIESGEGILSAKIDTLLALALALGYRLDTGLTPYENIMDKNPNPKAVKIIFDERSLVTPDEVIENQRIEITELRQELTEALAARVCCDATLDAERLRVNELCAWKKKAINLYPDLERME